MTFVPDSGSTQPLCSVEDCPNAVHAKGLCQKHYRREQRHGDVHATRKPRRAKSAREIALAEERAQAPRWDEVERECTKCHQTKPVTDFAKGDGGRRRKVCKKCKELQHRLWRERNSAHVTEWHQEYDQTPERKAAHAARERRRYDSKAEQARDRTLQKRYGITLDQYNDLLAQQGGVCAICKKACKSGRLLAVDHDHETGERRGLLCMNCNRAIGWLGDDPELIQAALDYVLKYRS